MCEVGGSAILVFGCGFVNSGKFPQDLFLAIGRDVWVNIIFSLEQRRCQMV